MSQKDPKKETTTQQHLRIVNEIASIFEREFDDHDDIFFVIRTLRNIFLWDTEEDHVEWLFGRALDKYAKSNMEYIKNHFNLREK